MKIETDEWKNKVKEGAGVFGVDLDDQKLEKLQLYAVELIKWNSNTNLTAIVDPFEVAVKHIVDSLYPLKVLKDGYKVIDLGAGGGFPSIPLKIASGDINFVMVESIRKKVSFLKHTIRTLNLNGITAVNSRCEDLSSDPEYKSSFDIVISRAFTSIEKFVSFAEPFLSKDGKIVAMKGKGVEDEVRELDGLNLQYSVEKYKLPFIDSNRAQVIVNLQNR